VLFRSGCRQTVVPALLLLEDRAAPPLLSGTWREPCESVSNRLLAAHLTFECSFASRGSDRARGGRATARAPQWSRTAGGERAPAGL